MQSLNQFAAPLGRVLLSAIFILSGISKISGYEQTQGYMEMFGLSGALLPLVIALEVIGGLAVLLGWKIKWVAPALAGFTLVAAIVFHADFSDQMQMIMFMKNLSIAGALIFMFASGAGRFSLDNKSTKV
ncbi:DoxX family protein [Catenovulum sediminis]|uniref:DoxX family protein n=1 Tax=Catenovulum sediminis TaxID=1740262 RepID=A0ABV1RCQ0_9ALTE|nr:DoxX family protein [Catenovulum sediminis]